MFAELLDNAGNGYAIPRVVSLYKELAALFERLAVYSTSVEIRGAFSFVRVIYGFSRECLRLSFAGRRRSRLRYTNFQPVLRSSISRLVELGYGAVMYSMLEVFVPRTSRIFCPKIAVFPRF